MTFGHVADDLSLAHVAFDMPEVCLGEESTKNAARIYRRFPMGAHLYYQRNVVCSDGIVNLFQVLSIVILVVEIAQFVTRARRSADLTRPRRTGMLYLRMV
jgi:hypothetical protein